MMFLKQNRKLSLKSFPGLKDQERDIMFSPSKP